GLPRVAGPDAALQAHLGGAPLPDIPRARRDLVEAAVVGLLARLEAVAALGEGAEPAAVGADVGVVDVAVDDVGHGLPAARGPERVGGAAHRGEVAPARLEQPRDLGFAEAFALRRAVEDALQLRAGLRGRLAGPDARHVRRGEGLAGAWRPVVLARETLAVLLPQRRGFHGGVEPLLRLRQ